MLSTHSSVTFWLPNLSVGENVVDFGKHSLFMTSLSCYWVSFAYSHQIIGIFHQPWWGGWLNPALSLTTIIENKTASILQTVWSVFVNNTSCPFVNSVLSCSENVSTWSNRSLAWAQQLFILPCFVQWWEELATTRLSRGVVSQNNLSNFITTIRLNM